MALTFTEAQWNAREVEKAAELKQAADVRDAALADRDKAIVALASLNATIDSLKAQTAQLAATAADATVAAKGAEVAVAELAEIKETLIKGTEDDVLALAEKHRKTDLERAIDAATAERDAAQAKLDALTAGVR